MVLASSVANKCAIKLVMILLLVVQPWSAVQAANIAYIHGDVSANGAVPSGAAEPYDQMLITDTGNTGLSQFAALVRGQGHTITQNYDVDTTLNAAFFNGLDVVIFGLHQKIWSPAERNALDIWLRAGGGMLIYSDSASGGRFNLVGAQNPVGQNVTNNLIATYGMNVTVDQADGTTGQTVVSTPLNILLESQVLEGEGVSPIEVNDSAVQVLIPYNRNVSKQQGLPANGSRNFASMAIRAIGQGHVSVMFDRQPMWNNGPGSDINEKDNKEILRRMINFLAQSPTVVTPPVTPPAPNPNGFNTVGAIILLLD